jgi:peptidyl-dipeptidase A
MKLRTLFMIILGTIVLTLSSCKEERVEVVEIGPTLDSLQTKMEWLRYRLDLERWEKLTSGKSDSLAFFEGLERWVLSNHETFRSLLYGRAQLQNEEDKRRAELLLPLVMKARIDSEPELRAVVDSLTEKLEKPGVTLEGQWQSRGSLERQLLSDDNGVSREFAFRALYTADEETVALMSRLFRLRNQIARKFGYNDYLSMTLNESNFTLQDYRSLLQTMDSMTSAAYNRVIDDIRHGVPAGDVEIWDLSSPYGRAVSEINPYLPADSQLDYVEAGMRGIGFDIDALPIYLAGAAEETNWSARALIIRPPLDQRLVLALSDGLPGMQTLTEEMGDALRATTVAQSDPMFKRLGNGIWEASMKRIFADIMLSTDWLQRFAFVPANLLEDFKTAHKAHEVVQIRLTLVNMAFEYEAYKNPDRDLTRLYWDLVSKYLHLPHHEDLQPWALHLEYVARPATSHHSLLARIISAQTLAYLNRYQESIVNTPQTRAFLEQNYFRFGSRFPWDDLVLRGTTEKVDPKYLIERIGS